jgi:hypothetical protein
MTECWRRRWTEWPGRAIDADDADLLTLEIVRRGEQLTFQQWAELFLEDTSKPPLRTPKTHESNTRCAMHFTKAFGAS